MARLWLLLWSLIISGCAATPPARFTSGWLEQLPTKKVGVVVHAYSYQDVSLTEWVPSFSAALSPLETQTLESTVATRVVQALRQRGADAYIVQELPRGEHIWLWRDEVGTHATVEWPGADTASLAEKGRRALAERYLNKLRDFAQRNQGTTLLYVCMPVGESNRIDGRDYLQPVIFHVHAPLARRCSTRSPVAAIDDRLTLIARGEFSGGVAAEIDQEYEKRLFTSGFRYRRLSLSEWAGKVSEAVIEAMGMKV